MLYQELYQAGGDPSKLNISSVIYLSGNKSDSTAAIQASSNEEGVFPAHCHSFYEIEYSTSGYAELELDDELIPLPSGRLVFFTPLTIHRIMKDTRDSTLILQFSPQLVSSIFCSYPNAALYPSGTLLKDLCVDVKKGSPIHRALEKLYRVSSHLRLFTEDTDKQWTDFPAEQEILIHSATVELLSTLVQEGLLKISEAEIGAGNLAKMQGLLNRLITAPEEKLSMEDAAATVGMSYSNFCRTFKETVGTSYVDFCNNTRIRRAQELLRNTSMSVTEISAALNFGSISYFNRIFRQHTGCTPLAYRKSN